MKWFKHMTDMSQDVKVKRIIRKFGVEGYGLYCYILELIVRKLESENPVPDLEETSHDIATDLSMDTVRVEEIMWFCMEQGLFEQDELTGRLCAHKVYKFLQQSETRSEYLRKMISDYKDKKECLGLSETNVKNRIEKKRKEENRTEDTTRTRMINHPTLSLHLGSTRWERICVEYGESVCDSYLDKIVRWEDAKKGGKRQYKDYAAACEDWLKRDKVAPVRKEKPVDDEFTELARRS